MTTDRRDLTPEERARETIDASLEAAGWAVQDREDMNVGAALGVAVREFKTDVGFADYLLYVDKKPAGVIEAKKEGVVLTGIEAQTQDKGHSRTRCGVWDPITPSDFEQPGPSTGSDVVRASGGH